MKKNYNNEIYTKVSEHEKDILNHKFGKVKKSRCFHFLHYFLLITICLYFILAMQAITEKGFNYGYNMYEKYQYKKNIANFVRIGDEISLVHKQNRDHSNMKQPFSVTVNQVKEKEGNYCFQFSIHNQSDYPLMLEDVFEDSPIKFVSGGKKEQLNLYLNEDNDCIIFSKIMIMPHQTAKVYSSLYDKKIKEGNYLIIGNNKVDVYHQPKKVNKINPDKKNNLFDISHSPYQKSYITPKKTKYSLKDTIHLKDGSIKQYQFYNPEENSVKDYSLHLKNIHRLTPDDDSNIDEEYYKNYNIVDVELEVKNVTSQLLQLPYADRFMFYQWEPGVFASANTEEFNLKIPSKSISNYQYRLYVPKSMKKITVCLLPAKDYIDTSDTSLSVSYSTPLIQNIIPLQWEISIPKE